MKRKFWVVFWLGVCLLACSCSRKPVSESARASGEGTILELDPALKDLVPENAVIEKVVGGFRFTEGPIWIKEGQPGLLFSDIPNNVILKWTPDGLIETYRKPSGFSGTTPMPGGEPGSNGLTLDKQGRLTICEQGDRRVTRLEKDGKVTVLADKYQEKKFNSPNDIVYRSDGSLYFTDPPYGLPDEKARELDFQGVYRISSEGQLQLLVQDLSRPNGLAFSPDEKLLYVANSDATRKVWMVYDVAADGSLGPGRVFADVTSEKEDGLPDGMKVDVRGNLYCTGPGGVWVFSPQGKHLGTIKPAEIPANCNWGDAEGKTLYITARTSVYRIRLNIPGIRP